MAPYRPDKLYTVLDVKNYGQVQLIMHPNRGPHGGVSMEDNLGGSVVAKVMKEGVSAEIFQAALRQMGLDYSLPDGAKDGEWFKVENIYMREVGQYLGKDSEFVILAIDRLEEKVLLESTEKWLGRK